MQNKDIYCIGLMSGTSLDGLDLAYVKFDKSNYENFKILEAETISYSKKWKDELKNSITFSKEKLELLDVEYGKFLGSQVLNFIENFSINKIDFIASHGHTVLHEPHKGITLQIGNGQELANVTQKKIVCDFRTQDVELGGQGAPLVPIGDKLLFSNFDYCINLGGFANISFEKNNERIAFDICPVNIVLNHYCRRIGLDFDDKGNLASEGIIDELLLKELNSLSFYSKQPPKSLGLEWVKENIFPVIENYKLETKDLLRTFVEHVAIQISKNLLPNKNVLITGGGVFNDFLIERIRSLSGAKISLPSKEIIEFKEALIFAFLGLLRLENKVNCLKSVTGAEKDHSSGVIFSPQK